MLLVVFMALMTSAALHVGCDEVLASIVAILTNHVDKLAGLRVSHMVDQLALKDWIVSSQILFTHHRCLIHGHLGQILSLHHRLPPLLSKNRIIKGELIILSFLHLDGLCI